MERELTHGANVPVKGWGVVGFDTETKMDRTGLGHPVHTELTLAQIADPDAGKVYLVNEGFEALKWLENPDLTKIMHNAHFDWAQMYHHCGIDMQEGIFDTMVVEGMINAARPQKISNYKLGTVTFWHLGKMRNKDVGKEFAAGATLSESMIEYAAEDAWDLLAIRDSQMEDLQRYQPSELVLRLEMRAVPVIAKMIYNGLPLNERKWLTLAERKEEELRALEVELSKLLTGSYREGLFGPSSSVNFNSHVQIRRLLKENGIPVESTRREVLEDKAIQYPPGSKARTILEKLVSRSKLQKSISTYGANWVDRISPVTGCVHSSIFQTKAETGRISSFGPNITNIPDDPAYRYCFEADRGYCYIKADFSQQELRILAHMCQDPVLLDAFDRGLDPHQAVADFLGVERKAGKTLNFALIYGLGIRSLAFRLGCTESQARSLFNKYKGRFKRVYDFALQLVEDAERDLYAETLIGRRRYGDPVSAGFTGQMRNHPIQGGGADMLKTSAILVEQYLGDAGKLVNLVHDETGVICKKRDRHDVAALVKEAMIDGSAMIIDVPMEVDVHIGPAWGMDTWN